MIKIDNSKVQVVSFSGGRTSAYMVWLIESMRKSGEWAAPVEYIFMDTGAEHPKTYEFIKKCFEHFGINLTCLRGNFEQPSDKGVTLPDILGIPAKNFKIYQKDKPEKPRPSNLKSSCLTGTANAAGNHSQMDVIVMNGANIPLTNTGRIDIKSSHLVRRYSVPECEQLQTVPIAYTKPVSNSQAYKMLINGWTVDVIAHIFSQMQPVV